MDPLIGNWDVNGIVLSQLDDTDLYHVCRSNKSILAYCQSHPLLVSRYNHIQDVSQHVKKWMLNLVDGDEMIFFIEKFEDLGHFLTPNELFFVEMKLAKRYGIHKDYYYKISIQLIKQKIKLTINVMTNGSTLKNISLEEITWYDLYDILFILFDNNPSHFFKKDKSVYYIDDCIQFTK